MAAQLCEQCSSRGGEGICGGFDCSNGETGSVFGTKVLKDESRDWLCDECVSLERTSRGAQSKCVKPTWLRLQVSEYGSYKGFGKEGPIKGKVGRKNIEYRISNIR